MKFSLRLQPEAFRAKVAVGQGQPTPFACMSATSGVTPVLISLCNRHAKKSFTWRQLTVAQNLEVVQRDVAVAYRIQIDKDQWLIYRTLAEAARRTALGMHTLSDFFAGRVKNNGDLDTLVEVEAAAEEPAKEPAK